MSRASKYPDVFTQWVGDNVDHNIRTLDGKDTFHGMRLISISASPRTVVDIPDCVVPRIKQRLPAQEVAAGRGLPITEYERPERSGLSNVKLVPIKELL
jgi:hypothetical protein